MESLKLKPSIWKSLLVTLASSAFVIGGIFMIREGSPAGYLVTGFFGLGIPVGLLQFFPNNTFLLLDSKGFTIQASFKPSFTSWNDVKRFEIARLPGIPITSGSAIADAVHRPKVISIVYEETYTKHEKARAFAKGISQGQLEGGISNVYKISDQELVNLLNEWLEKYKTNPTQMLNQ